MALISLPHVFSIPFSKYRLLPVILLIVMIGLVVFGYFTRGINYGVDFRGGLIIEAQLSKEQDLNVLRKNLKQTFVKDFSIQEIGKSEKTILIRTEQVPDTSVFLKNMKSVLGEDTEYRRIESIGPKVGQELILNGCYAILCALLGIMIFVWLRFEWQFSVCAFIALLHDCLGILAFFIFSQIEFNESAVVAILITASYSVNDTVVIFDRLRDNLVFKSGLSLSKILNLSLNETLSRTLLTSSTTLLALAMLYLFGGEVISAFSLPIFVGIIIGTYSSVVIAVPLLRWLPSLKGQNQA